MLSSSWLRYGCRLSFSFQTARVRKLISTPINLVLASIWKLGYRSIGTRCFFPHDQLRSQLLWALTLISSLTTKNLHHGQEPHLRNLVVDHPLVCRLAHRWPLCWLLDSPSGTIDSDDVQLLFFVFRLQADSIFFFSPSSFSYSPLKPASHSSRVFRTSSRNWSPGPVTLDMPFPTANRTSLLHFKSAGIFGDNEEEEVSGIVKKQRTARRFIHGIPCYLVGVVHQR